MHLLYVDESGSASDKDQALFILAGVSIFERQTHWIEQKLNEIAERFDPVSPKPDKPEPKNVLTRSREEREEKPRQVWFFFASKAASREKFFSQMAKT